MADKDKDLIPEGQTGSNSERVREQMPEVWTADETAEAMTLAEARETLDIDVLMVKAKDLVGRSFYLVGASTFPSAYEAQGEDPYFCICYDPENKEKFGVVLGGQQPHQIITNYIGSGTRAPIYVKLCFHKGGKHDGYYTLIDPMETCP